LTFAPPGGCPFPLRLLGRPLRNTTVPFHRHIDNAMVKAIARAFRWRDMLESGEYATIRESASAEKINETWSAACCG